MHPPNAALRRHAQFHSAFLPDDRDVLVWLPPGYEDEVGRRYPVLYMHDGQNLFDPDTAFSLLVQARIRNTTNNSVSTIGSSFARLRSNASAFSR